MMDEKRAAAIAGVMHYLQQEADELEDQSLRMAMRHRSGWSENGRKTIARGQRLTQGRRIRRTQNDALPGRLYRLGLTQPAQQERDIDPVSLAQASGMQIPENKSEG